MIHYDEYGDKNNPTILLLHGAAALDTFCKQYYLSRNYHLVVPHLHGAGSSADKPYDPTLLVKEIFELVDFFNKKQVGIIGHSIGGQLALMLIDSNSEKFCFAVILSAWINPTRKSIYKYTLFSTLTSNLLKWKWLVRLQGNYWNYSQDQINYLVNYSTKITAEVYSSFFTNTLKFSDLKNYSKLDLPILAICGGNELKDMKQSLDLLSINSNCKTMIIKNGNHNFPMRKYKELNSILNEFIETNSDN